MSPANSEFDSTTMTVNSQAVVFAGVAAYFVVILVHLAAFYGIIWYEHNASDLKRLFINRMVTSASVSIMVWIVAVQIPEMLQHVAGPFPVWFCRLHVVLKNATLIQIVLFYDALVIVRYLSIFVLKNPLSFQNEFWTFFVDVFVVIFSFASQTVNLFTSGTDPLQVKVCSGRLEPNVAAVNLNWQLMVILLTSLVIHIAANLRIKIFKVRQNVKCWAIANSVRNSSKMNAVAVVENLVISDCIANFCILVAIVLTGTLTLAVDDIDPTKAREYPEIAVIYFDHFVAPFILTTTIIVLYFTRHPPLAASLRRQLRNLVFGPDQVQTRF